VNPSRILLLAALYLGLIFGGAFIGQQLTDLVAFDIRPSNEPEVHGAIMTCTAAYILASAIPFVPGAEIGLGMMLLLGPRIAVLVYGSMVAALMIAYLIGRLIPPAATARAFAVLGLRRARDLSLDLAPLDTGARLRLLTARAPRRIVPFLLRHRYLALALAFNLPGNTLLGGGGGIALAAGLTGLYSPGGYALTVVLAVLPVPLMIFLTGHHP
jgi:hypothetical protein